MALAVVKRLEPVLNFLAKELSVHCIYVPALSLGCNQNEKAIRAM